MSMCDTKKMEIPFHEILNIPKTGDGQTHLKCN